MNKILRQRKTKDPCGICFLHKDLCICEVIPKLNLATKVSLIIHAKELKRTTNTGRLALHALVNSEMFVRGLKDDLVDTSKLLDEKFESILFFPSDDAIDLSTYVQKTKKPIQLIVPDGNWRQASKVNTRYPALQNIPRVKINDVNLATSHLRKEHTANGMSTLEAIASALGILEGKSVGSQMHALYQAKLKATLKGRGILLG